MRPWTLLSVVFGLAAGVVAGVGSYTFFYAEGWSYMTNDPKACVNCHVMDSQYRAWTRSSHHAVAVCNDCHAPHDFLGKYTTKAINGWNHSYAFTTGDFHEPIMITGFNERIVEKNCRDCHSDIAHYVDHVRRPTEKASCIRCHSDVGHMH